MHTWVAGQKVSKYMKVSKKIRARTKYHPTPSKVKWSTPELAASASLQLLFLEQNASQLKPSCIVLSFSSPSKTIVLN